MIDKIAYAIQVSVNIPEEELAIARKASDSFSELLANIATFSKHLQYFITSFSEKNVDPKDIVDNRRMFREYRDQVLDNFETIIANAFQAMSLFGEFSSDSTVEEVISSLASKIEEVQDYLQKFIVIFGNLSSDSFVADVVKLLQSVKRSINQFEQIVTDRALQYIDRNLLGRTLISYRTKMEGLLELENKIKNRVPDIIRLFQERQQAAMGVGPDDN